MCFGWPLLDPPVVHSSRELLRETKASLRERFFKEDIRTFLLRWYLLRLYRALWRMVFWMKRSEDLFLEQLRDGRSNKEISQSFEIANQSAS